MDKYHGVIEDKRSQYEKEKDYQFHELFGAAPIKWEEKPQDKWNRFSIRDQDGSSSCVAQGSAKATEILLKNIMSAHPIYARRANMPSEGMYLQNAGDILRLKGTTLEKVDPSQNMNEQQMNAPVTVDTPITVDFYGFVKIDMDMIAQALDKFYALPICFSLKKGEWTDIPTIIPGAPDWGGHCVCVVDRFLKDGKKYLLIDDSWGHATSMGNGGQRLISEEFLKARCSGVMFFVPKLEHPIPKPVHNFTKNLKYGMHDPEVAFLQDILKYERLMPVSYTANGDVEPSTTYFGAATKAGVIKFQEKYAADILTPIGLIKGTGNFYEASRTKANALYTLQNH